MGMRPRATIFFGVFATDVDWDDYLEDSGDRSAYEICEDISTDAMAASNHGYEGNDMILCIPGTDNTYDWDDVSEVSAPQIDDARKIRFMADVAALGHGTDEPRWLIAVEYG